MRKYPLVKHRGVMFISLSKVRIFKLLLIICDYSYSCLRIQLWLPANEKEKTC